jgi:hypothetical protein
LWPWSHIEIPLPQHFPREGTVAIEPGIESRHSLDMWPNPNIVDVVAGTIRVVNNTCDPKYLKNNEHICQVLDTIPITDI